MPNKTYVGIGLTAEERDFLLDGYAFSVCMKALQRDSDEYKAAAIKLRNTHIKHGNLIDSINDKVKAFSKGDE